MRTVIYPAHHPATQRLGFAGFIEDHVGHTNIGWHPTREAAEKAAKLTINKETST
jgi:hypothetical protein